LLIKNVDINNAASLSQSLLIQRFISQLTVFLMSFFQYVA